MKQRLFCDKCADWRICSTKNITSIESTLKGDVEVIGHTSLCDTCHDVVWSPIDRDYNMRAKKKAREIKGVVG